MTAGIPITEDVFWVGVNDRETGLFESLWPMPRGMAYNSYLIRDEKVALVDAVKALFAADFVGRVRSLVGPGGKIDYLIINHLEPDHSGGIRLLLELNPQIRIVGNKKTAEFLQELYGISENIMVVEDGETLDLGKRRLQFLHTPMVHWPETMMTYDTGDRILFSGDAFGGYGSLEAGIFDDQVRDRGWYEEEALRYFANVIGKYSPMVQKALEKVRSVEFALVAPAHGLVWRRDPTRVMDLYDLWSRHEPAPGAVVAYGSMYGNTGKMAETLAFRLSEAGIVDVRVHDVSKTHLSYVLRDVWRAKALVLGTPTYNLGVFPAVDSLTRLLEDKKLRNRLIGVFGTYGWSGGGVKGIREFSERAGWELVEPVVEARFAPKRGDFEEISLLARNLADRLRA